MGSSSIWSTSLCLSTSWWRWCLRSPCSLSIHCNFCCSGAINHARGDNRVKQWIAPGSPDTQSFQSAKHVEQAMPRSPAPRRILTITQHNQSTEMFVSSSLLPQTHLLFFSKRGDSNAEKGWKEQQQPSKSHWEDWWGPSLCYQFIRFFRTLLQKHPFSFAHTQMYANGWLAIEIKDEATHCSVLLYLHPSLISCHCCAHPWHWAQ